MISAPSRPTSSSTLDFSALKANAQRRLFNLLGRFEGTKTIVWDEKLIGPFEFVANASILKKHDAVQMFKLADFRLTSSINTEFILFFLQKDYQVAKDVAEILHRADRVTLAKTSLVFVPQRCASIEKILQQHKLDLEKLNSIEELPIHLFVLDTDLLSMENESVYKDMYLNEDYSAIHQIVEGLIELQDIYGPIPRIAGQGKGAKLVCDLLLERRKLGEAKKVAPTANPQIHQLILIDRRIDLVTPFLTQLTYEGLLDEVFGIHHGTITLPSEKFQQIEEGNKQNQNGQQKKPPKPPLEKPSATKRFDLRSSEELFAKLRDCHINAVAETLKQSARNLQAEYDECNSQGKTIHEMGKIVKRLNHLKIAKSSQSNHVAIAELVNEHTLKPEFIQGLRIEHELLQEDRINRIIPDIDTKLLRQEPAMHVVRLICIQSIMNNGLKQKICETYKREIIQNYGPNYLLFLMNLEKAHILLSPERYYDNGTFAQLKAKFNLINDNVDECNPNHISYVYGGYAPLSVMAAKALAQYSQGPQWRSFSENLKLLPEPTVTYTDPTLSQQQANQVGATNAAGEFSGGSLTSSAVAAASMLLSAGAAASNVTGFRARRNSATSSHSSSEDSRTVLVFFIGGCTFAEISALRYLSQQEENNCEFFVGTSKIINGRSFLNSFWPRFTGGGPLTVAQ